MAVVIDGTLLSVEGQEKITERNETSIAEYGELLYSLKENALIQTREAAERIASLLVSTYAQTRRDVEVQWCGDTAPTLTDDFRVPVYQKNGIDTRAICKITKNKIDFDGSIRMSMTGRRLREDETIPPYTEYQDTDGSATTWQNTDGPYDRYQASDDTTP